MPNPTDMLAKLFLDKVADSSEAITCLIKNWKDIKGFKGTPNTLDRIKSHIKTMEFHISEFYKEVEEETNSQRLKDLPGKTDEQP